MTEDDLDGSQRLNLNGEQIMALTKLDSFYVKHVRANEGRSSEDKIDTAHEIVSQIETQAEQEGVGASGSLLCTISEHEATILDEMVEAYLSWDEGDEDVQETVAPLRMSK